MKIKMLKTVAAGLAAIVIGTGSIGAFAAPMVKKNNRKAGVAVTHPKTVRISITKDGFSPSTIRAEKGYELTLIFNRADDNGCGTEVVFPALNIRKELPLKKDVSIVITPDKAGEIAFTCGTGAMKGAIVAH